MARKSHKQRKSIDVKNIQPITKAQEKVFQAFDTNFNIVMSGCAGTGKTFLALYLALDEILAKDSEYKDIKIFRSAVQTRDMGFLKGCQNEKLAVYESPYVGLVNEICNCGTAYESLKASNRIEFLSTSFNRGITINDSIILVDEVQNMTDHEINTIITRMGKNSRIIFCGDLFQLDLNSYKEKSGLGNLIAIAERMNKDFRVIKFKPDDIVRNDMIKRYLEARIGLGIDGT